MPERRAAATASTRARRWPLLLALVGVAGCGAKKRAAVGAGPTADGGVDAAGAAAIADDARLPPPPPLPPLPAGLPPLPADVAPTPAEVALGELLFWDPRLGADGTTACASCHAPEHGYSGTEPHPRTAAGKPSLRRAPALVNLAWSPALGWDGRGGDFTSWLPNHVRGQLNQSLAGIAVELDGIPGYRAHFERTEAGRSRGDTVLAALTAFVQTRYDGGSPWDLHEAAGGGDPALVAGYALFTGKALCASCHPPPLYTDHGFHRLGLVASPDDGRGRADPALGGAFATPGLRGAARRQRFFHDGSATSLAAAIAWHLDGGRGQGAAAALIDPGLPPVVLTAAERADLEAFVAALTAAGPPPTRPPLPGAP
ncbi:MAG: cytochrome c peroxidase [Kofleriaceae bacterium]